MIRNPQRLDDYIRQAAQAGCPRDQVRNFLESKVILQPKQLLASAAARECDRDDGPTEIAYGGARGGGKSAWTLAQMSADDCQRVPGLKGLLLRKVGKSARESLNDLRFQLLMGIKHEFSAARGVIRFENGSRIITGHFQNEKDIDAYLGLEYDVIAVEEGTTLQLQKVKNIKTCLRTSKPNWRPRLYTNANPGGIGHSWFKERFIVPWRDKCEVETRFVPALVTDNRFTNASYLKNLDDLTGWQLRAWRFGDWDIAAGQYFTTFSRDHHKFDGPFDRRRARTWFASMDYGYTHFNVILLGCIDGDGMVWIIDQHAERQRLVEDHAEAMKAMLARHGLTVSDLDYRVAGSDIFASESDGRTIADQYKECGIRWAPAQMDRINGWAAITKLLGDHVRGKPARIKIHERCGRLLNTLPELQHDPDRPEDVLKVDVDEEGNGGDDAADALRYGVFYRLRQGTVQKLSGM